MGKGVLSRVKKIKQYNENFSQIEFQTKETEGKKVKTRKGRGIRYTYS